TPPAAEAGWPEAATEASAAEVALAPPPLSGVWSECGSVSLPVRVTGQPSTVVGLAASPDGQWLVDTTSETVHAWRVAPRFDESTVAWTFGTELEMFPSFSRDGAFVAVSGDGRHVFETATGARVYDPDGAPLGAVPPGRCWLWFLAFSTQGKW